MRAWREDEGVATLLDAEVLEEGPSRREEIDVETDHDRSPRGEPDFLHVGAVLFAGPVADRPSALLALRGGRSIQCGC